MKRLSLKIVTGLLLVVGLVLLVLTNMGILSFDQSYVKTFSDELPETNSVVAFVNVNVVPMDSERILENQTVIVRDGIIEAVAESEQIKVPQEAHIIDGQGNYLMPGLVDMHVHIQFADDLLLFAANGVTSVRNMWGFTGKAVQFGLPDQLVLREQIAQGALYGPTIYTTGPVMEGSPPFHPMAEVIESPEAARVSVAWQKAQGYDFIKVYDHLSLDVYQAILEAAELHEIPVVGHVPFAVGLDNVLAGGQQTIEHMSGYVNPDTVTLIIPEDQLEAYAIKTREAGVWNVVTLSEYPKSKETPEGIERLQNQQGMAYLSPLWKLFTPFYYEQSGKSHTYPHADYPQQMAALNAQMLVALNDADAGILLGTDAWQGYHIPGFSIHEELEMFVEAGLTPYEALAAGTRSAAEAMGKLDEFGTIAPGKRADLLLLANNPLQDVTAAQERMGVMVNGRYLTQAQLQSMLDGLVQSYKPNLIERLWPAGLIAVAIYMILRKSQQTDS